MARKTVFAYPLNDITDPLAVFSSLYRFPYTQFLDSLSPAEKAGRYSYIAFHPVEMIEAWGQKITVTNRDQQLSLKANITELLQQRLDVWGHGPVMTDPTLPPFQGGAIGYFASTIKVPDKEVIEDVPYVAFGIYDQCVAFDYFENQAWYIAVCENDEIALQKYRHFRTLITRQFLPASGAVQPELSWGPVNLPAAVKENVRRLSDYCAAGSFENAYLGEAFEARIPAGYDSLAHYSVLRSQGRSPLGACLNLGKINAMILDCESLLSVNQRQIEVTHCSHRTKRIWGSLRDEVAAKSLSQDKAALSEHQTKAKNFVVTLSGLCKADGILGPSAPKVAATGQEYQIESVTRGVLAADTTLDDIVRMVSPATAYNGQPLERASRMIASMENRSRGPAFAVTALIGFNGFISLNQNKSTLVNNGHELRYIVGAPVTAQTNPDSWYSSLRDEADHILPTLNNNAANAFGMTA